MARRACPGGAGRPTTTRTGTPSTRPRRGRGWLAVRDSWKMSARSAARPTVRFVMAVAWPAVRWWGRLQVCGLEHLLTLCAERVAGNYDSYWCPVATGIAGLARRQIGA